MYSLEEDELKDVYEWVDSFTLSKAKRNIARDFSDGVLVSEILKHYFPELVNLHSYIAYNNNDMKIDNWKLLNKCVFKKIGFVHSKEHIRDIANSQEMAIETFLHSLKNFILMYQEKEEDKKVQKVEKHKTLKEKMLNVQNTTYNDSGKKPTLVNELEDIIGILQVKIKKMEMSLGLKEEKIEGLTKKLQDRGITV